MNARTMAKVKLGTRSAPSVRSSLLQCKRAYGGSAGFDGECEECCKNKIQRKAWNPEQRTENDLPTPRIVHELLRSFDQSLDVPTHTFEAPHFGHDFSRVLVHPDDKATDSMSLETKARSNVSDSSMRMASQFAGSHPTFQNWGGGTLCKSPLFKVTAEVSVPPAMANGDLTVGFMQALVGCTGPKGRYWDATDTPYMTAFAPYKSLPLRDAEGGIFYGPEAQKVVDSPTVAVSMSDQPQSSLPWTTPDGKGNLQQVVGEENFISWLVVKSDSTGEVAPIRHFVWSIGWFAAVDESLKEGISFDVGKVNAGEGQGALAPIRSGPVANESGLPTQWEPWT